MKITLEDCLNGYGSNVVISLGARSGYLDIRTNHELIERLPEIDKYLKNLAKRNILSAEQKRAYMMSQSLKDDKWKKKYRKNESYIKYYSSYLENYIPLAHRIVKDVYVRIDRESGLAVVVEGNEVGKYWTRDEVKN